MSARNYDYILQLDDNVSDFSSGNTITGNTNNVVAYVASVDTANSNIKVKMANAVSYFSVGDSIQSNSALIESVAYTISNSSPYETVDYLGETTTAAANIVAIYPSPFIAEKNAFTQNPIVKLITIYYPGEWYPPNQYGNPTQQGLGRAWPNDFPFRVAEVQGDYISDINYNVTYDGISYAPYPINISAIEQASDGKINEVTLVAFNSDNILTEFVEDPFLAGNNISNSVIAYVNGEAVHGIDPRTVNANPADLGVEGEDAFDSLTRARANGLSYDENVVGFYGKSNASFTRNQTIAVNGTWQEQKLDTRDLLGGVVEIKTTFANFLDYWPEYSIMSSYTSNVTNDYIVDFYMNPDAASTFTSLNNVDDASGRLVANLATFNDGVIWETGSSVTGSILYTYAGNLYFQTGSGSAFGSSSNRAECRWQIEDTENAIIEWTRSTSGNAAALYIDGNLVAADNTPTALTSISGSNIGGMGQVHDQVAVNRAGWTADGEGVYPNTIVNSAVFIGEVTQDANSISGTSTLVSNTVTLFTTLPYRVGDKVFSNNSRYAVEIISIANTNVLYTNSSLTGGTVSGEPLYIKNEDADSESYIEDVFKIDQLESLNSTVATFGLISWLQYFKVTVPKRKYYKNTCQWTYKGPECQYPGPGGLPIPGTRSAVSNTNPIAANNQIASSETEDICSKSFEACSIRNNQIHFGGFTGTGRTIPRQ